MMSSQFSYVAVARGRGNDSVILVEQCNTDASIKQTVDALLPNISVANNTKRTFTGYSQVLHCLVENGLIYLCAVDSGCGYQIPYNFLEDVKNRFCSGGSLVQRAQVVHAYDLNRDFAPVLQQLMKKRYDEGGNVGEVRRQVNDVKTVMTENINKVIDRGERLDILVDKTVELEASSNSFAATATKVRKKYWWKNVRCWILLIFFILIIITLIILLATCVIPIC